MLYSTCSLSGVLLLVYGYIVGFLSPGEAAFALGLLIGASYLVVALGTVKFGRKGAAESPEATAAAALDPATRKRRIFAIQVWKLLIALLVLGLVSGLSKARDVPLWLTLVGVTMNLILTVSLLWVVVRLQRSLK